MNSKPVIIFPYLGYENNKKCEWYFWWTIDRCKMIDPKPIVVVPRDTIIRGDAVSFLKDERYKTLEVLQTWSVDSCQTWLAGWGHVLDNYPQVERIVQIPGDIDFVEEDVEFYDNLKAFIETSGSDIVIGDFRAGDQYSAKSLVDTYGTYSLLANWFPEISKSIKSLPLNKEIQPSRPAAGISALGLSSARLPEADRHRTTIIEHTAANVFIRLPPIG